MRNSALMADKPYRTARTCCLLLQRFDEAIFKASDRGHIFTTSRIIDLDGYRIDAGYILGEKYHDEWPHQVLRDNYVVSYPLLDSHLRQEDEDLAPTENAMRVACMLARKRLLFRQERTIGQLRTNAWIFTSTFFTVQERERVWKEFTHRGVLTQYNETLRKLTPGDEVDDECERQLRIRFDAELTGLAAVLTRNAQQLIGDPTFLVG